MKRLSLLTASVLLVGSIASGANFTLNFFGPFATVPHTGKDGMLWGIVITTNSDPSGAFNTLGNLNPNQFEHGLGVSGQWLTEDLYYLTGSNAIGENNIPRTISRNTPQGERLGTFGTLQDIEIPIGPGGEHDFSNASLALIWFDLKGEIPEEGRISAVPGEDKYNFLHIENFTLTQGSGLVTVFNSYKPEYGENTLSTERVFVPEPSTYAVLLAGMALGGCATARRRTNRRAVSAR